MSSPLTVAYLFTTFPKSTETFLQREIVGMQRQGVRLRIYSLWGGGGEFRGIPVSRFNPWRLLTLLWGIPWFALTRWDVFGVLLKGLCTRKAPSWLNFWENMLGAGFAGVCYREFRRDPPDLIHAAWGGGPATAAWILAQLSGHRFSAAAHAYDLYEHGGDWWLNEKLAGAAFVHTSTQMGGASLLARGLQPSRVAVIRRGLEQLPLLKPLRVTRSPLRILCIARLVEKKGLLRQVDVYARLQKRGMEFEARILGDGPLRDALRDKVTLLGLGESVHLLGHCSQEEVGRQLAWADVLVHTGVVSATGDRDGLPNVIPEAMAAGAVVVTSPAAATTEAIVNEGTGLVAEVGDLPAWETALVRISTDDTLCERLRLAARAWVEENFDAHRNASQLYHRFRAAVTETAARENPRKASVLIL